MGQRVSYRIGLGILDQGVYSLSNFLLGVSVARVSSAEVFGAFSTAYLGYLLALGVARAVLGDVIIIKFSDRRLASHVTFARIVAGLYLRLGASLGLVMAAGGLIVKGRGFIVLFGLALLPLLLQDGFRYLFVAVRRNDLVLAMDLLWLGLFVAAGLALFASDLATPFFLALAWAAAGGTSSAVGVVFWGGTTISSPLRRWLRRNQRIVRSLMLEFAATRGGNQTAMIAMAGIVGFAPVAGLRVAHLACGPLTVLFEGAQTFGVAEAKRRRREFGPHTVAVRIAIGLAGVASVLGAILIASPDSAGKALFGPSWLFASGVMGIVIVQKVFVAGSIGAITALRASERVAEGATARSIGSLVGFAGAIIGAMAAGVTGGAIGLATGASVTTVALWRVLRRSRPDTMSADQLVQRMSMHD